MTSGIRWVILTPKPLAVITAPSLQQAEAIAQEKFGLRYEIARVESLVNYDEKLDERRAIARTYFARQVKKEQGR